MNELIQPGRGFLVAVAESVPQRMGTRHIVSEFRLERAIAKALDLPPAEKDLIGVTARNWFLDNDRAFRARFLAAITRLVAG